MNFSIKLLLLVCLLGYFSLGSNAQEKPIGAWNSFLPYNSCYGLATDKKTLFAISKQAYSSFAWLTDKSFETYSKVNGMSDIGMQCIGYDATTETVILIYSDGNIDLFKNNTFYNIPDFKIKSITGTKQINSVYAENGLAYLSSSVGVIVLDLAHFNISETYQFMNGNQLVPVNGFIGMGNYFYVITSKGLLRAAKSNPALQNYQAWQTLDSAHALMNIATLGNTLFAATSNQIYVLQSDTLARIYTGAAPIEHLDAGISSLFISEQNVNGYSGFVKKMDSIFHIKDSIATQGFPVQTVQLADTSVWIADRTAGMSIWRNTGFNPILPPGPADYAAYDIYANNKSLWIAHGGFNDTYRPLNSTRGFSHYKDDKWITYQAWAYPPFWDTLVDFVSLARDETNGITYAGTYGGWGQGGLFALKDDGTYTINKFDVFDPGNSGGVQIIGMTFDNNNNLWATDFGALHELNVKEAATGNWYKYHVNNFTRPNLNYASGPVVVDDYGQAWWVAAYKDGGVLGYNTNGTLSYTGDDTAVQLLSGTGNGNLPSNYALSIAKDHNGAIWIGTENGIGIINQPENCVKRHCDVQIPIVQYDQYAGYLFSGENVRSIAVDGANRKWVGTDNGVWLLSADAGKIIYRFTVDNSPLPSNHIVKIAIDAATGDVYFGTDQGVISFRGNATEGGDTNNNVLVFPNPIPATYTGQIAIKGLVSNADVRITDISGQLVYRTTAYGGQATWNGADYKGHRPQSGVYLIFVSNTDNSQTGTTGAQTYVGKIVFVQ
jgi:Two component regulator propeller